MRAGLVDDVDGLVGQQLFVDVLGRQLDRGLQRFVRVLDVVVLLVLRRFSPSRILIESSTEGSSPRRSSGSAARAPGRGRRRSCTPGRWSTRCSAACPLASAGLSRLDASIEPPLVAPAPTMVWISSMKRIALGCSLRALSTAFRRSSNCPRNLVPASSAPMSSEYTTSLRAPQGPCPRKWPARGPRRWPSCPRPARPRRGGCSFGGGRAPEWCARAPARAADERVDVALGRLGVEVVCSRRRAGSVAGALAVIVVSARRGVLRALATALRDLAVLLDRRHARCTVEGRTEVSALFLDERRAPALSTSRNNATSTCAPSMVSFCSTDMRVDTRRAG
jgi:hypothetical protein